MEESLDVVVMCRMNELDKPQKHRVKGGERISSKAEKKLLKSWNILYCNNSVYPFWHQVRLSAQLLDMKFQNGYIRKHS